MRRLRVGVLDLVTKGPTTSLYGRIMNPNLASIMPQVVAVWCEREGHDVTLVCYTGFEDLLEELPADLDVLFIGAFTQAAQLAYALSAMFRARGVVTVLGGPHARCYPEDAQQYFDYVLGFTDRAVIAEVLQEAAPSRPLGRHIAAARQPEELPSLRERWKYVEATLSKAPTIKIVPMLGSLGCPYTCSFCIDSTVDYQPLGFGQLRDDLTFLLERDEAPDRRAGTTPTSASASTTTWRRSRRRCPRAGCGTSPRAASRCSRRSTCSGSNRMGSRPSCPASSRGTTWATNRRRGAPAWTRSSRSPSTST